MLETLVFTVGKFEGRISAEIMGNSVHVLDKSVKIFYDNGPVDKVRPLKGLTCLTLAIFLAHQKTPSLLDVHGQSLLIDYDYHNP